ncbi:MAG TPA: T9SS type A sorting domain-containing protein [Bacteroidia bacterium]|nr:T9SS type A sorting domain-containing protein [Bacteroidia bacterium]
MKRCHFIPVLIFWLFSHASMAVNGYLTITQLNGFPIANGDTAYDSRTYDSVQVMIRNIGNQAITDQYDVLIRGNTGITDTLYSDTSSAQLLNPGDSLQLNPSPYLFDIVHYDDGDNIVVVWPVARTTPNIQVDTMSFHVYFVRLSGIHETPESALTVYPNPASDYLRLEFPEKNRLRYVRIFNSYGQLVLHSKVDSNLIPISDLSKGVYLIELTGSDGKAYFAKIIKN